MNKAVVSLFLALIILVGLVKEMQAQTFKPGLIAGMTTSQVGGDGYSGFNKIGVTFGGFVRYHLRESWSAQFEIYYIQKGSRNAFSINKNDPNQSAEYFMLRMNYAEIPLVFKFNFRKFVYEAGVYYGQLVGFYMEYRDDQYNTTGPYPSLDEFNNQLKSNGLTNTVNNYDFGGILGIGYKITSNILGSVRVSNSILPVKKYESGAVDKYLTQINIGWTNTVIAGTLRYTFGEGDE